MAESRRADQEVDSEYLAAESGGDKGFGLTHIVSAACGKAVNVTFLDFL